MRIALKNTLALLALYLIMVIGLAFLIGSQLRSSVRQLMNNTAELVGGEITAALHEPSIRHLLGEQMPGDQDLTEIIITAKQRSDTLLAIEVVNARGTVVASDDARTDGQPRLLPDMVFHEHLEPVLLSTFQHRFWDGEHLLLTPLMQGGKLLGYISTALSDRDITALYDHVYLTLILAALVGLATIIALGVLLQLQLRRTGAELAALVKTIAGGGTESPSGALDEFAEVRRAAGLLGNELSAARGRATLAQTKLDAVANLFDVGIVVLGADGAPEYVNETARWLLVGDRPEEFEARFADVRAALDEAIGKLRQTAGLASVKHIEISGDASVPKRLRVEVHTLGAPEDKGSLLVIKDRDVIDALDEDLRAATRSRSLSRLYAATAHDLKAPLNAMSLHLEMLKRVLTADDANGPGRRLHYIEVLNQELARLNSLLYSVLEQGAPTAEGRAVMDLKQVIEGLATLVRPHARHQRVTLEVDLPSEPSPVFGNAGQIKQALLNVTLNALECVPEGGRVDIQLTAHPSVALIAISDNGPGIPAALQFSIFDMHFTTKETGTGIGLYVAREVIENHGGEIRLESKLGAGTCFHIPLPLHRASREAETALEAAGEGR